MNRCEKDDDKAFNPDCITKLYAVKDENGVFKLENVIDYDTRNWKRYNYKNIKYIVQPFVKFNKRRAKEAVLFCNKIAKMRFMMGYIMSAPKIPNKLPPMINDHNEMSARPVYL